MRNTIETTRASSWGGARANAGRRPSRAIASEPHKTRPALAARHPIHVTARVQRSLGTLQRRRAYQALHRALATSLARTDFRIVRLAILPSRLELIVEADDKLALARGMQGFQVAAARRLNRAASRHGCVFPDRYRSAILRTRPAVRAALAHLPTRTHAEAPAAAPCSPATWLLRIELRPRVRGSPDQPRLSARSRARSSRGTSRASPYTRS